ncbi:unnamed protein product [Alopecurus aequalis]
MASPALLRSAASRVLRRVPSPQSPRIFLSGVAGRTESCKLPCSDGRFEMALNELEACTRETRELVQVMLEQEKRSQWHLQLQKKIACVLLPTTAAVWIFVPGKKGKSSAEEQASP